MCLLLLQTISQHVAAFSSTAPITFMIKSTFSPRRGFVSLSTYRSRAKLSTTTPRSCSVMRDMTMNVEVSFPTPGEAADMGARDWPQQAKSGSWTENVESGGIRYILDGSGTLSDGKSEVRLGPGVLVTVLNDCSLEWTCEGEMIILTPSFEEGPLLAAVAIILIGLCAFLVGSS